jgi:hypothetical protein
VGQFYARQAVYPGTVEAQGKDHSRTVRYDQICLAHYGVKRFVFLSGYNHFGIKGDDMKMLPLTVSRFPGRFDPVQGLSFIKKIDWIAQDVLTGYVIFRQCDFPLVLKVVSSFKLNFRLSGPLTHDYL